MKKAAVSFTIFRKKKVLKKVLLLLSVFLTTSTFADSQENENWDVYMASYKNGPGSTLVNMSLRTLAPIKSLPYLLITGVRFKECSEEGLPINDALSKLYPVSDSVSAVLNRSVNNKMAGTFTYQCQRLDYFYLSDTNNIRSTLSTLYKTSFDEYEPVITLQKDDRWYQYTEFLFPNEVTQEFMRNNKVIMKLKEAGDQLAKERPIEHIFFFPTEKDRDAFVRNSVTDRYKIIGMEKINSPFVSYQLILSSNEKVDLELMNKTTLAFRRDAKKYNGQYDGWETSVVK